MCAFPVSGVDKRLRSPTFEGVNLFIEIKKALLKGMGWGGKGCRHISLMKDYHLDYHLDVHVCKKNILKEHLKILTNFLKA